MSDMEREYLERRRQECLKRADIAANPAVGQVHRDFAAAYGSRLDGRAGDSSPPDGDDDGRSARR